MIEEGTVDVVRDGEPSHRWAPATWWARSSARAASTIASVVARTPVRALTLHVDALQEITAEMPELGEELRVLMDRRRSENEPG